MARSRRYRKAKTKRRRSQKRRNSQLPTPPTTDLSVRGDVYKLRNRLADLEATIDSVSAERVAHRWEGTAISFVALVVLVVEIFLIEPARIVQRIELEMAASVDAEDPKLSYSARHVRRDQVHIYDILVTNSGGAIGLDDYGTVEVAFDTEIVHFDWTTRYDSDTVFEEPGADHKSYVVTFKHMGRRSSFGFEVGSRSTISGPPSLVHANKPFVGTCHFDGRYLGSGDCSKLPVRDDGTEAEATRRMLQEPKAQELDKPVLTYHARHRHESGMNKYDIAVTSNSDAVVAGHRGVLSLAFTEAIDNIAWLPPYGSQGVSGDLVNASSFVVSFGEHRGGLLFRLEVSSQGILRGLPVLVYGATMSSGTCDFADTYVVVGKCLTDGQSY